MSTRDAFVRHKHGAPRRYTSAEQLRRRAILHAEDRLLTACEAIAMCGALASKWKGSRTPVLSIHGARWQDGSAHRVAKADVRSRSDELGEQAAHLLPGQIRVDGTDPAELGWCGAEMRAAWYALFHVTVALPTDYNRADTAAEEHGYREAFIEACRSAWLRVAAGEVDLTPTFRVFLAAAARAFRSAEVAKQHEARVQALAGNADASTDRSVEAVLLRLYRAHSVTDRSAAKRRPLTAYRP